MDDVSAESIAKGILSKIEELGLDIKNCGGQGYDGASTMSGHVSGVQKAPVKSVRTLCQPLFKLGFKPQFSSAADSEYVHILSDIINFFNYSPKRRGVLDSPF